MKVVLIILENSELDGNVSFLSQSTLSSLHSDSVAGQPIQTIISCSVRQDSVPPPVWHEPYTQRTVCPPVIQTIRRNSKLLQCLSLPVMSVSNVRSLLRKINSFKRDVLERGIGLALLSEIWEVKGKKKHISEIEKMLEVEGLKYICMCYCG